MIDKKSKRSTEYNRNIEKDLSSPFLFTKSIYLLIYIEETKSLIPQEANR